MQISCRITEHSIVVLCPLFHEEPNGLTTNYYYCSRGIAVCRCRTTSPLKGNGEGMKQKGTMANLKICISMECRSHK